MIPDPDPAFKVEYQSRRDTGFDDQNVNFFQFLWVIFALLDPDPDPLIGLNPYPDPKQWENAMYYVKIK